MAQQFNLPEALGGIKDQDGYRRFKHVFIPLRDGVKICADIFIPTSSIESGVKVPVLTSLGPYGKDVNSAVFGLPKTDIYANMYKNIKPAGEDSVFEVVHPLTWVSSNSEANVNDLTLTWHSAKNLSTLSFAATLAVRVRVRVRLIRLVCGALKPLEVTQKAKVPAASSFDASTEKLISCSQTCTISSNGSACSHGTVAELP